MQAVQSHGRRPSYDDRSRTPRQFASHERQRSRPSVEYDIIPASYRNPPHVATPAQPSAQPPDEPENTGRRRARTTSSSKEPRPIPSYSVPLTLAESSYRMPNQEPLNTTTRPPLAKQASHDSGWRRQRTDSAAAAVERGVLRRVDTSQSKRSRRSWSEDARNFRNNRRASKGSAADTYDVPVSWLNLTDVSDAGPVQNVDENALCRYQSLEDERRRNQERLREHATEKTAPEEEDAAPEDPGQRKRTGEEMQVSRFVTQVYAISYLILFSFLGTLARLGLQWLTDYPGAPVFPSAWFNFGGSLVMGFLAEDRMLFRNEWGTPNYERQLRKAKLDEESGGGSDGLAVDLTAAKKAHLATKKTIPLYIGLATGFCGSFTSFSSFVRDVFLALSNDLAQPGQNTTTPRNGGYSFMAILAVVITTVAVSLSGLFVGAHLAIVSEPLVPSLPFRFTRKVVDPFAVVLGWGCWVGALLLTAMPPHTAWRGDATFALVFAPVGTLMRFYVSLWMNGLNPAFPVGTFLVNILGTAILGMSWDLQRVPLGGVIGCQVLQGVEDGFCGCLTTVSTWVSELAALRRRNAWVYGAASVLVALGIMTAVMGSVRWTIGYSALRCTH